MGSLSESMYKLMRFDRNAFVLPEWIFIDKNGVKICHFETKKTDDKNGTGTDHVFMFHL